MAANTGTGSTPQRAFRSPDDLWLPGLEAAAERGESLSAVLNRAIADYIGVPVPAEYAAPTQAPAAAK